MSQELFVLYIYIYIIYVRFYPFHSANRLSHALVTRSHCTIMCYSSLTLRRPPSLVRYPGHCPNFVTVLNLDS
jgi:hypothetical protein